MYIYVYIYRRVCGDREEIQCLARVRKTGPSPASFPPTSTPSLTCSQSSAGISHGGYRY